MVDANNKRKRRISRPLLIAGAVLLFLGISSLVGARVYIFITNRTTSRAQEKLFTAWEEVRHDNKSNGTDLDGGIARLRIPRLKLDAIVVELNDLDDRENLKRGPGHVPGTAYPGQAGNVVIAGHRTTYGAPFKEIEKIQKGDKITTETMSGTFTYEVVESRTVSNKDLSILDQEGYPRLIIFACHPPFHATQRLTVTARLIK